MSIVRKLAAELDCNVCGQVKPATEFYVGVTSRCRECHRKAVRENRAANAEHYREFDRKRAWNPDRVAARKAYQEAVKDDPDFTARVRERRKFWQDRNMVKRRAHVMTGNAMRNGKLKKPAACERCGGTGRGVEAHHENYYKPLEVTWLCADCHGIRHREINAEIRAGANFKHRGF